MLIQPDIAELGDTRLDPNESLAKIKAETHDMLEAKGCFLYGQAELEDIERAHGHRLEWREFIRRLTKVNRNLLIKDGLEGHVAVYAPKLHDDQDERDPSRPDWWNDHRYITGFAKSTLSEFSTITTDERGLPKREVRGWRSVLIALIKTRAITYRDAVREFGEPLGARGWRWREQLQTHKGI
jgi:hypothetical protein